MTAPRLRRAAVACAGTVGAIAVGLGLSRGSLALLATVGVDLSPVLRVWLSTLLLQGVAFVGGTLLLYRRTDLRLGDLGFRLPDGGAWILGGFLLAFAGAVTVGALLRSVGVGPVPGDGAGPAPEIGVSVMQGLLSVLVVGPGEELFFRGGLQRYLDGAFTTPVALLLANALFAAGHAVPLSDANGATAFAVLVPFAPGLVFAVAYRRTGSIFVPALLHGLYDAAISVYVVIVLASAA